MAGPHNFARIVVRGHALSTGEPRTKPVYNVYDFSRTGTGGTPSKSQIITAFKTNILTPLQACLSVSYVTDTIECRFIDDALDPFLLQNLAMNGTVSGDSLPSINNVVMNLLSTLRGGSYRGRKFYGPIAKSDTVLDHLSAGALTNWATFATALLAGFTDAGAFVWFPVVVSAKTSNLKPPTPIINATAISSIITNAQLGELRKRSETHRSAA